MLVNINPVAFVSASQISSIAMNHRIDGFGERYVVVITLKNTDKDQTFFLFKRDTDDEMTALDRKEAAQKFSDIIDDIKAKAKRL